jgi:hypothetical protein
VFVTNTVTFVPPMLKVGDELPPKLYPEQEFKESNELVLVDRIIN